MKSNPLCSWARLPLAMAVGGTLAFLPAAARAGDQEKPAKAPAITRSAPAPTSPATRVGAKHPKPAPQEEVITGSLIPQKVKPSKAPASSSMPLVVIDRKAIDRSGASTVSEVLARTVPSAR
jgi:hypothetical protein